MAWKHLRRFLQGLFVFACLSFPCQARYSGLRGALLRLHKVHDGGGAGVEEQWFTQRLDHFDGAETRVWKQRFFVNDTFYRSGGPVFLMIGGEGPANPAWMQYGTWLTYAKKLGALCFMLEHRFYGKSHPTEDLSFASLRYLSSQQALADLAHFRSSMAAARGLTGSKWVAFGGSYPGSLATWFRLKYPHLVHASVATSAPVHAVVNFPEYLEVVRQSLAAENPECPLLVQEASDTLYRRLQDPETHANITKDFSLCADLQIQTKMDIPYFLETVAGNFMDVVQYNEDNREFEGVPGTNITIKVLCGVMMDASLGTPYSRYAAVTSLMLKTFSQKCLDVSYSTYLKDMSNTSWSGPAAGGGRQWVYQTCTEFGFYQSTDSPNQPFTGFPLQTSAMTFRRSSSKALHIVRTCTLHDSRTPPSWDWHGITSSCFFRGGCSSECTFWPEAWAPPPSLFDTDHLHGTFSLCEWLPQTRRLALPVLPAASCFSTSLFEILEQ